MIELFNIFYGKSSRDRVCFTLAAHLIWIYYISGSQLSHVAGGHTALRGQHSATVMSTAVTHRGCSKASHGWVRICQTTVFGCGLGQVIESKSPLSHPQIIPQIEILKKNYLTNYGERKQGTASRGVKGQWELRVSLWCTPRGVALPRFPSAGALGLCPIPGLTTAKKGLPAWPHPSQPTHTASELRVSLSPNPAVKGKKAGG